MSTQNKSSFLRTLAISVTAFGCAAGLFLSASAFVTHGHGVERSSSNSAAHTTSLRVSETPGGSCVVLTADQSLKSYEAYRRGDWFGVQIPSSKVPHADLIRAREFTEIKIELISDATIVSFRLQPGVTARAELKGDNLQILFVASRARTMTTAAIDSPATNRNPGIKRAQKVTPGANLKSAASRAGNTTGSGVALATIASTRKHVTPGSVRNPVPMAESHDSAQADAEVPASAQAESSADSVPETLTSETAIDPPPAQPETDWSAASIAVTAAPNSVWNNLRENANYWFQLAQLNPAPAGIGVGLMVLLVGLVVIERCIARKVSTNAVLAEELTAEATEFETETAVVPDMSAANTTVEKRTSAREVDANREVTIGTAIGKLVVDNTHRAEIVDSRSPEDRKAIESFLITAITTAESSDNDRRRARQALEEYGFVAQHSAALLKGKDAWERASAARTLGVIGSKSSMPFLIEALNDSDYIVRNEAVASLAALQDPAAIGALVEAARKHPDVPASLLSETLSACSVGNLEVLDLPSSDTASLSESVVPLEDDAEWLDELRDDATDEILSGWLAPLDKADEHPFEEISQQMVPPRIGTSAHERPYLRVVA